MKIDVKLVKIVKKKVACIEHMYKYVCIYMFLLGIMYVMFDISVIYI